MEIECSIEGQLDNSIHIHVGGTVCYIVIAKLEDNIIWQVGSSITKRYIANGYSSDFIDALERALSIFILNDNNLNLRARKLLNASVNSGGKYVKTTI